MSGPIKFMILAIVTGIKSISGIFNFEKDMDENQSIAGLSVCYQWVPPIIAVDGTDKLSGGADTCDDGVVIVAVA